MADTHRMEGEQFLQGGLGLPALSLQSHIHLETQTVFGNTVFVAATR